MTDLPATPANPHDAADAAPPAPPAAPGAAARLLRVGIGAGVGAAGLAAAAVALLVGTVSTEGGTRWLLAHAPGVQAQGVSGSLMGPGLAVQRLQATLPSGLTVEVDDLRGEGLRWTWRPHAGAWAALALDRLTARQVVLRPAPATTPAPPATAPQALRLPLALTVAALSVDRLQWADTAPVTGLRARLSLGADGGALHRVDGLDLNLGPLHLAGSAQLQADAPLRLQSAWTLQPIAAPSAASAPAATAAAPAPLDWRATLTADGPLADLAVAGTLQGGRAADARLTLDTRVQPFAAWPVSRLALQAQQVDLAALWPGLPRTRLGGQAALATAAADQPAQAEVALENTDPGRWDEQRLPVRRLDLRAAAVPRQHDALELTAFDLLLADRAGPRGRIRGSGQWDARTLRLQTLWQAVQMQRLDARAAAVSVDGPLTLTATGAPGPDTAGAPQAADAWARAAWRLQVDLRGRRTSGRAPPLAVQADARWAADTLTVPQLRAQAGAATLEAALTARRRGAAWSLDSTGAVQALDPADWWAGPANAPWVPGQQQLNLRWTAQGALPAAPRDAAALWAAVQGQATLDLGASRWAGLPLTGRAAVRAQADGVQAEVDAQAGDNRLALRATAPPTDRLDLRWSADLQAPAPAALAPLVAGWPALAAAWPRGGSVQAQASGQGRWPAIVTEGSLQARGWRAPRLALDEATLRWRLPADPAAPWLLDARLTGLAQGEARIDRAVLQLDGSARSHAATWQVDAPLQPPAWLAEALGRPAASGGLQAAGRIEGEWLSAAGRLWPAQGWRGRLVALGVADRPTEGDARAGAALPRPWLQLQPGAGGTALALEFDTDGAPRAMRADAGAARLADTATLRWDALSWQAGAAGAPARWQARARMDPLPVAPFLQRSQPDIGWQGDLRMRATMALDAGTDFAASVVLEREAGDLSVGSDTVDGGRLALGLSDLRFALNAQDGTWYFTQAFAGRRLGELAGAQTVRTTAQARWPAPDTPLEGVLQGRVADLGTWGAWVPPGWRLAGALQATASFGGRFGAPEVTGRLSGEKLGARQVLEGVAFGDGEMDVALEGTRARIERFRLRAGDGELQVTGGATLGAEPRADLRITARQFRALGRVDRRVVVSGDATLALARDLLDLNGQLTVDEGLIDFSRAGAPTLDDDVIVRRPGQAEDDDGPAPREPPEALKRAKVALRVNLGEQLHVVGRGLDTRLTGELRVSLPSGRPDIRGRVRAESGQYAAYGQKLDITRGLIAFNGPADNPRLDIEAIRPNLDVRVGVAVTGNAQAPRIRLVSEPEMPEYDKLSWLVLGRAPDGLGRTDTALLQRAAVALLAGEEGGATDPVLGALGLDDFSVRQSDGEVRDTIVSLGKQLSRRWYLGYERSVNATTGTWQLIYRAAQRFTLRAQGGDESSLDLIWTWRWGR